MDDDILFGGRFIWNYYKAERNKAVHGIAFEAVIKIFDDIFNSEYEDRYRLTGYVDSLSYVTVSYTIRDKLIRIISARSADSEERRMYDENIKRHIGKR